MGIVRRVGLPSLAGAGFQALAGAVGWVLLVPSGRDDVLLGVWFVAAAVAGLIDSAACVYGGRTRTLRRRLMLGGIREAGVGARILLGAGAVALGNVVGWMLAGTPSEFAELGIPALQAMFAGLAFAAGGGLAGLLLFLMIVVPIGWLVAAALPDDGERRGNSFTVMSVGELRGGAILLLSILPLGIALTTIIGRHAADEHDALWVVVAVVSAGAVVVGVVLTRRGVRERRRAGITTPWDRE